ncbi:MAG: tetratricopeptide repeat protein [Bacteroidia bacterium]
MKYRNLYIFLILMCCCQLGAGQNHKMDSLLNALNSAKEDTTRLRIYTELCYACDINDNLKFGEQTVAFADKLLSQITDDIERKSILKQKAEALNIIAVYYEGSNNNEVKQDPIQKIKMLEYLDKSLKIYEKIDDKQGSAQIFFNMAEIFFDKGLISKALEYQLKSLALHQEIGSKKGIASNFFGIAGIYDSQGNYTKALEYGFKAITAFEEEKDTHLIARSLFRLGGIYQDKGDSSKALQYAFKAMTMFQQMGNKQAMAGVLNTIVDYYIDDKNYSKGMKYALKDLAICKEIPEEKAWVADCFSRIAKIDRALGNNVEALDYYFKSLKIYRETGVKKNINRLYLRIGILYSGPVKNYKLSKSYLDSAINGSKNIGQIDNLTAAYKQAAELDSLSNNYKAEVEDYKNYVLSLDSFKNQANSQQTLKMEMSYEFDQLQAEEKVEQAQKDLQASADKHKQKIITWSVASGLLLVMVFAGFVFRSLRITNKQKKVIEIKSKETEEQKKVVEQRNKVIEEKNKDILDSITYAKRLQDAILPPISLIKQFLPESFLLYKPKDIVAGDFYWMERAGDNILIAAADCTGHGVPGAMVSVVCSNALNRTVKEFKITEPGKILDKVRELVLETFEKSESNVQDGMDISLCYINTITKETQWSGAYNSLWYIRNGEVIEVPADKQPIGKIDKPIPFNTHDLNLQKGDILYLFTDGYADQFGGPKGKKFKYKQLQELLLANASKPMEEQKNALEATLEAWKGGLEQVDDILVIGIRV